jgi:hypothetical protein
LIFFSLSPTFSLAVTKSKLSKLAHFVQQRAQHCIFGLLWCRRGRHGCALQMFVMDIMTLISIAAYIASVRDVIFARRVVQDRLGVGDVLHYELGDEMSCWCSSSGSGCLIRHVHAGKWRCRCLCPEV